MSHISINYNKSLKKQKVLIISADYPYPLDTGKKVVLNGLLTYCSKRYGNENISWLLIGSNTDSKQLSEQLTVNVCALKLPNIITRLISFIWHTVILKSKSIQESVFYSNNIRHYVMEYIHMLNPDLIIYDTIRMGQFHCHEYKDKSILYLDDLFSIRYELMIDQLKMGNTLGSTVLGNFTRFIPIAFQRIINNKTIQLLLLTYEKKLVRSSEIAQSRLYTKSLLLNHSEVKLLRSIVPDSNIQFIPPYIPVVNTVPRKYTGSSTYVYLGALKYPPNENGLIEFFKSGFENAVNNIPGFELIIIGKGASDQLLNEIDARRDHVKYLGYVEDLAPIFASCCAILLPILFGTGVKLKALEAMSRGVPIVSTMKGIESVPVTHDVDCYIEDDLSKFWVWMKYLTNPQINRRISDSAIEKFTKYYSPESVFNQYDHVFSIQSNCTEYL